MARSLVLPGGPSTGCPAGSAAGGLLAGAPPVGCLRLLQCGLGCSCAAACRGQPVGDVQEVEGVAGGPVRGLDHVVEVQRQQHVAAVLQSLRGAATRGSMLLLATEVTIRSTPCLVSAAAQHYSAAATRGTLMIVAFGATAGAPGPRRLQQHLLLGSDQVKSSTWTGLASHMHARQDVVPLATHQHPQRLCHRQRAVGGPVRQLGLLLR